ncbi:MAG: riboflavin synthase [Candidatus Diapherotrites archaeon]
MKKIGIADTMFACADMGALCGRTLRTEGDARIVRLTVPGIKDLPVAAKKLLAEQDCGIVIALGMPGSKPIDKECALVASQGLQNAALQTGRHIIEVFVHEDEGKNEKQMREIMRERTVKHARNALALLRNEKGGNCKNSLRALAGTGQRQGSVNADQFEL